MTEMQNCFNVVFAQQTLKNSLFKLTAILNAVNLKREYYAECYTETYYALETMY